MQNTIPVTIVFTQQGECLHSWETDLAAANPLDMLEAVSNTGLVEAGSPVEFIVYDDRVTDAESPVLLQGTLEEALFNVQTSDDNN